MGATTPEALVARISELEAENAQLTVERNEALAMRRWNIDRTDGGEVLVCRGHHDKGEDCDHERFVPEERLATATAEAASLRAERDAEREAHAVSARGRNLFASEAVSLRAEVEAKDKRIAELTAALKPFADDARTYGNHPCDGSGLLYDCVRSDLRVRHLRAARTALARAATAGEGRSDG